MSMPLRGSDQVTRKYRMPEPVYRRKGRLLTDADIPDSPSQADAQIPAAWLLGPAPQPPGRYRLVTTDVITDRNASAARVSLCENGHVLLTATGSAKREPGDPDNPAIADGLALGRALVNLGRQIRDEQLAAMHAAARELEAERLRIISKVRRAINRARERNHPQHHFMDADAIRAEWGQEAADRHLARQVRRQKGEGQP